MAEQARPQLRSISPDATPEEVAAITAAIAASLQTAGGVAAPAMRRTGSRVGAGRRGCRGRRGRLLPGRLAALGPARAPQPGVSS